jgi:NAD-dependent deacetylase
MKKVVVLTGAGISAESGIKTFRDSDGLWENHRIEDVASPEGWYRNKEMVLDFYNQRRKQLLQCEPNTAHTSLAKLESKYDVTIITQNVDDLHERGGSSRVIHLHGELLKARSSADESLVYEWKRDIKLNDKCTKGSQMRPHIVWFGEAVPKMEEAIPIVRNADIFLVVGTSLVVYPAAGLVNYARWEIPKFILDRRIPYTSSLYNLKEIEKAAGDGIGELKMMLEELL